MEWNRHKTININGRAVAQCKEGLFLVTRPQLNGVDFTTFPAYTLLGLQGPSDRDGVGGIEIHPNNRIRVLGFCSVNVADWSHTVDAWAYASVVEKLVKEQSEMDSRFGYVRTTELGNDIIISVSLFVNSVTFQGMDDEFRQYVSGVTKPLTEFVQSADEKFQDTFEV